MNPFYFLEQQTLKWTLEIKKNNFNPNFVEIHEIECNMKQYVQGVCNLMRLDLILVLCFNTMN